MSYKKLHTLKTYNALFENSSTNAKSKGYVNYTPPKLPKSSGVFTPYSRIPAIGKPFSQPSNEINYSSDEDMVKSKHPQSSMQRKPQRARWKKTSANYTSNTHNKLLLRRNTYVVLEPVVLGKIRKLRKESRIEDVKDISSDDRNKALNSSLLFGSAIYTPIEKNQSDVMNNLEENESRFDTLGKLINDLQLSSKPTTNLPLNEGEKWLIS